MEKENAFGPTVILMKECLRKINFMEKVYSQSKMAQNMMDNGEMVFVMAMVYYFCQMALNIREIGSMIKKKAKEFSFPRMERNMMVNLKMVLEMALVLLFLLLVTSMKEIGRMINAMV